MASETGGRLEAMITIPTGGWGPIDMEDSTSAFTVTLDAGDYYWSGPDPVQATNGLPGLLDHWVDKCTAAGHAGWGFTPDSDFKLEVTKAGGTCTITWDAASDDIKNALGFTSNVSSSRQKSDEQMEAVWLAPCPVQSGHYKVKSNFDEFRGRLETDFISTQSMSGLVTGYADNSSYVRTLSWPHVTKARTWIAHETLANESFEYFLLNNLCGRAPYATPGGPVRWEQDQGSSSSQPDSGDSPSQYKVVLTQDFAPQLVQENWNGLYTITLDRLVLLPALFS